MPKLHLLVADPDAALAPALSGALPAAAFRITTTADLAAAQERFAQGGVDAVVVSTRLAGAQDWLARLTEIEQLEARVEERTRALLDAEAKAAQNERLAALGQLAGGVAHEINNPLGAIVVFARTAARDLPASHPAASDLLEIQKAARQAQKIVQSLLMFSRRTPPEERKPLDLAALVRQSQPLLQAVSKTPLRYELGPVASVAGNASRLQQVLLNLVANADQASAGRGEVAVRLYAEGGSAVLEVSDEGPGVPAEILAHIFEPFFTTKPQGSGTGLGLAIAYGIVREHGGEISAENLRPAGSRFRVRLPLPAQEQRVA